jgi:hypothetical protein
MKQNEICVTNFSLDTSPSVPNSTKICQVLLEMKYGWTDGWTYKPGFPLCVHSLEYNKINSELLF